MKRFAIIAALLLSGCASYWIPDATVNRGVEAVQYVAAPCNDPKLYGCYMPSLQVIQINSTVLDYMQADALSHEQKHAQGFRHDQWPFNGRIHRGDEF